MRLVSLLFIVDGEKVLLAKKKKKFGAGYWNGFGGGVEEGETIEQSACRETKEECGLDVHVEDLRQVAHIMFRFEHKPEYDHDVHVFVTNTYAGHPTESDEMGPFEWHECAKLPLDHMWPSDPYWMPLVLTEGKTIEAECVFTGSEKPFPVGSFEYKEVEF